MRRCLLLLLWGASLGLAQDLSKLPDWAAAAAQASLADPVPSDAEGWVLLDRTEIAYAGDGEIRERRLRLIKVLEERGTSLGTFRLSGLGGKASKVKRLKGWNLRPDGELVKLDSDHVVTIHDASMETEYSTETLTGASLGRVVKGSYVAFESLESIKNPVGPVAVTFIFETLPIRTWELDVAKKEGWFTNLQSVEIKLDRRRFAPWITQVEEIGNGGMRLKNLPALPKDEGAHPPSAKTLPSVQVRFLDPKFPQAAMWGSWDTYARWVAEVYTPAFEPPGVADTKGQKGLAGLTALWAWMARNMTYKQVYLSPERGWVPESASEVGRKRYGDCKDLTAFFLGEAKGLGFQPATVLARIQAGQLEADEPPGLCFNHVIAGLRLETSLGLPAEVTTPHGRFLLVDPTDPLTPLGYLSSAHHQGRVMLCLPEGAAWVEIPSSAILPERLEFNLKGEVTGRELKGTLVLKESGGYWNLRSTARHGGAKAVREALLKSHLDLPPTATLEVESLSEPLDLDRPFEVAFKLKHPEGFRTQGEEGFLPDLGIPPTRGAIQRMGKPRQLPVYSGAMGELSYRSELKFSFPMKPIALGKSGENSFRSFRWKSEATPEGGGTLMKLSLDHRFTPARFGFEAREQGLKAWKQDRVLTQALRDDLLVVRVGTR